MRFTSRLTLIVALTTWNLLVNAETKTCTVYARTDGVRLITGAFKVRRRVVYDTTKVLPDYDPQMYAYGWQWEDWKSVCGACAGNVQVYYHGKVIQLGAYVIDSDEELGNIGDMAHECMLGKFREALARQLDCNLVDGLEL
ncbi:hypothetical protein ACN47E_002371 [Coniothyrium glycines]